MSLSFPHCQSFLGTSLWREGMQRANQRHCPVPTPTEQTRVVECGKSEGGRAIVKTETGCYGSTPFCLAGAGGNHGLFMALGLFALPTQSG